MKDQPFSHTRTYFTFADATLQSHPAHPDYTSLMAHNMVVGREWEADSKADPSPSTMFELLVSEVDSPSPDEVEQNIRDFIATNDPRGKVRWYYVALAQPNEIMRFFIVRLHADPAIVAFKMQFAGVGRW